MLATVFIVDDDAAIRVGLQRLLQSAGYLARAFDSADTFLAATPADAEACLVLDVAMPGLNGLELQEAVAARGWVLPIVFLTGRGDVPASVKAMKGGAVDFLTKPVDQAVLFEAIGRAFIRARTERRDHADVAALRARFDTLTPREKEVMRLVAAGLLNKQIASGLGAAEKTIKVHRGRVMQKMQAQSVADLVRAADRLGVGEPTRRAPTT